MGKRYCEYNYPQLEQDQQETTLILHPRKENQKRRLSDVREFVNIYDQVGVGKSATIDNIVEVVNEQDGYESEEEDREMEVKLMMRLQGSIMW